MKTFVKVIFDKNCFDDDYDLCGFIDKIDEIYHEKFIFWADWIDGQGNSDYEIYADFGYGEREEAEEIIMEMMYEG